MARLIDEPAVDVNDEPMETDAPRPLGLVEARVARFLYGITGGTLAVRRDIAAPRDVVLDAVGRTVLHPPFDLRLHDSDGTHPLEGGTLTFTYLRVHSAGPMVQVTGSTFESVRFRARLAQIYLRSLDVQLEETSRGTVVEVRADLDREVRMGVRWYLAPVAAVGALIGGTAPAVIPSSWAPWAESPDTMSALSATLGACIGVLLIVASFRWFCRKAVQWVDEGLETMLEAVEADVTAPGPPMGPPAAR